MGLFNRLGRKVQELKREADAATADEATHRCTNCDSLLYRSYDECPDCGHDAVVAIENGATDE